MQVTGTLGTSKQEAGVQHIDLNGTMALAASLVAMNLMK